MSHPRVVNVRDRKARYEVYVGRGFCPRTRTPGKFGNPFAFETHGVDAMRLYLDYVSELLRAPAGLFARAVQQLKGKVLGCWCAPGPCHGEVLARLADGEELDVIRADLLARVDAWERGGAPLGELA